MLPKGAIHVPCEFGCLPVDALALRSAVKGVAKIARKLGFDFAEAVVSLAVSMRDFPFQLGPLDWFRVSQAASKPHH